MRLSARTPADVKMRDFTPIVKNICGRKKEKAPLLGEPFLLPASEPERLFGEASQKIDTGKDTPKKSLMLG